MGTKNNPGSFDCYANAEPTEPMFILLGRDPQAPKLVRDWAYGRLALVKSGVKPLAHLDKAIEAFRCADDMEVWQLATCISNAAALSKSLADEAKPDIAVPHAGETFMMNKAHAYDPYNPKKY